MFKTFGSVDDLLENTNLLKILYLDGKIYNISDINFNLMSGILLSNSISFIEATEEEYDNYISYNIKKELNDDNYTNFFNLVILSIDTKGKQHLLKYINNLNLNKNIIIISSIMCMLTYEDVKKYGNINVRRFYLKNYRYIYLQYINTILNVLKEEEIFRKILISIPKNINEEDKKKILIQKLSNNNVKFCSDLSCSTISSLINGINITYLYVLKYMRKDDITTWKQNEIKTLNRLMDSINNILNNGSYSHYLSRKYVTK